jgi:hypothetical protein
MRQQETTMLPLLLYRMRQQVLALVALGLALLSLERSTSIVPFNFPIEAMFDINALNGLDETSRIDLTRHDQIQSNASLRFPFKEDLSDLATESNLTVKPLDAEDIKDTSPPRRNASSTVTVDSNNMHRIQRNGYCWDI